MLYTVKCDIASANLSVDVLPTSAVLYLGASSVYFCMGWEGVTVWVCVDVPILVTQWAENETVGLGPWSGNVFLTGSSSGWSYPTGAILASFPGLLRLNFLIACILQAIKNWRCRRPGNGAKPYSIHLIPHQPCCVRGNVSLWALATGVVHSQEWVSGCLTSYECMSTVYCQHCVCARVCVCVCVCARAWICVCASDYCTLVSDAG